MINQENTIPCPVCNAKIPFDVNELLAGKSFSCPNCFAAVGLSNESKAVVEDTMEEFNKLKEQSSN